jgi:hypothetical protein
MVSSSEMTEKTSLPSAFHTPMTHSCVDYFMASEDDGFYLESPVTAFEIAKEKTACHPKGIKNIPFLLMPRPSYLLKHMEMRKPTAQIIRKKRINSNDGIPTVSFSHENNENCKPRNNQSIEFPINSEQNRPLDLIKKQVSELARCGNASAPILNLKRRRISNESDNNVATYQDTRKACVFVCNSGSLPILRHWNF